MNTDSLLKLFGLLTYTFVLITIVSGIRRVKINVHKIIAFIALLLASIHGLLVILFY